jgi:formate dehydrogenase subunit delta
MAGPELTMHDENEVRMANDIGNFFRSDPNREQAIEGIVNHISKFWTRRMREKLIEHVRKGAPGLDELPLEAAKRLMALPANAPRPATV